MKRAFLLAIVLLATYGNTAAQPEDEPRIVYTAGGDSSEDIYTIQPDGSDLQRLTDQDGEDIDPVWSPDGSQITFVSDRDGVSDIFIMNADGSDVQNLTSEAPADLLGILSNPAWSPDGSQIAFRSELDNESALFVVEVSELTITPLIDSTYTPSSPAWSPDGTQLAFIGNNDIYIANADGSDPQPLIETPTIERDVAWSPDGTQLAFASFSGEGASIFAEVRTSGQVFMLDEGYSMIGPAPSSICTIKADGTESACLDVAGWHPAWSPDGEQIVFVAGEMQSDLFVMNADGSDVVQLTENELDDAYPDW